MKGDGTGRLSAEDVVSRFRTAVAQVAPNLRNASKRAPANNAATLLKRAKRSEKQAARLLR
jgi:hypothetical protein